jgi:hypothetical protein
MIEKYLEACLSYQKNIEEIPACSLYKFTEFVGAIKSSSIIPDKIILLEHSYDLYSVYIKFHEKKLPILVDRSCLNLIQPKIKK